MTSTSTARAAATASRSRPATAAPPVAASHAAITTTHTLHPGDVALGRRGDRLVTLLGSCIAVVLTDRHRTIATMCHIVHARWDDHLADDATVHAGPAFRRMFALLTAAGIDAMQCEAYVYGGGNMFPNLVTHGAVGDRNADEVFVALGTLGIPVVSADVGGAVYRALAWTVGHDAPAVRAVAT